VTVFRLALRNILGAGLRAWLNAVVLSLVLVVIITAQGLLKGMNEQTARTAVATEYGGGQLWHAAYDPYDPLTLDDAHAPLPELVASLGPDAAAPVLIVQGAIYPEGRLKPILIKGIDPRQTVVDLPAHYLADDPDRAAGPDETPGSGDEIPAMIGTRMAAHTGLATGDVFIVQWRDRNGTFDAQEARVVEVIRTPVQSVDAGQIWVPLERLREMTGMPGEATLVTLASDVRGGGGSGDSPGGNSAGARVSRTADLVGNVTDATWVFRDPAFLLRDIRILIQSKMIGSMFVYAILLFLALLAVFDTQVFSIFKRQKEIGTLIALGMTRGDVVRLFTLEGTMSGLLAAVLAALYGVPLLAWFKRTGWHLPETTDSYGFAIGDVLYPVFSADVVLGTALVILVLTAVVSFLPARRIARVEPTLALRGKVF